MEAVSVERESIMFYVVAFILYIIGANFHIKIINLSRKEKDLTWKLDLTNSSFFIVIHLIIMFMHGITHVIPDLHTYTGEWWCYTFRVMVHYANLYHIGHSLIVSILKYIIIVKWEKLTNFKEKKLKEVFFWLNFLHPIIGLAFHFLVRSDFIYAYTGSTPSNRCLGEADYDVGQ